jgi:shikimate kinase
MPLRNLVITGFVGTGKTTVARILARRLGRPFLDFDEEIARRAGRSIPEIFDRDGEAAFRAMEAALCREWSTPRDGSWPPAGGPVSTPPTGLPWPPEAISSSCMRTSTKSPGGWPTPPIAPSSGSGRETLLERLQALWNAREAAYRAIPHWVDTTGRSPEAVAEEILRRLQELERTDDDDPHRGPDPML